MFCLILRLLGVLGRKLHYMEHGIERNMGVALGSGTALAGRTGVETEHSDGGDIAFSGSTGAEGAWFGMSYHTASTGFCIMVGYLHFFENRC